MGLVLHYTSLARQGIEPEKVLRIAVLSLIHPAEDAGGASRASLRVGGHSLARHQLALAMALGCERVICLAPPGHDPDLAILQQVAEDAGVLFYRVPGLHGLLALVAAGDEVIALCDGLLAWPDAAVRLLGAAPVVLAQPVELGLVAGFERLDINHASAGAMRVPGRLMEKLAEWPADVDIFSCLQRIALQAGVPLRSLTDDVAASGHWVLVRSEAEAHAIEPRWIASHAREDGSAGPARWMAGLGVRAFGPALLHAGSSGTVVALAALAASGLALVAGWFGLVCVGLLFCALAWVCFESAALFGRFERRSLLLPRPRMAPTALYGWVMDGTLLFLLAWQEVAPGEALIHRGFAPVMLLGLMRLVPPLLVGRRAVWLGDRSLLALLLVLSAMLGMLRVAIAAAALGLLITGILAVGRQPKPPPV